MELSKYEQLALEWLKEAWERYPEPMLSVHSAYGLARRSYGTKHSRGTEFWLKTLENLEKKGLVKRDELNPNIWRICNDDPSWVKVTVATFKTREEAEEFVERKRKEGDIRPYKIEKKFYPLFGEERWEVCVFSEAKKHWLFRDLPEVPLRGTLVPYIEAARVKPIEEFVRSKPRLKPEDTGKLADYFLNKLREAGVPLPTRFKSEFEKALDINKSYEENLKILDEVIARIIAKESGRRVHPLEEFRVVYTPHLAPLIYELQYKVHGRWDTKGFKSFEEIRDFLRKGIGELYVHAFRGKELVTWEPIDLPRFTLEPGERVETANFIYTLEQPFFESTEKRWIWRVGVWDKTKQESKEIEMSENEWRKLKESVKAVKRVKKEGCGLNREEGRGAADAIRGILHSGKFKPHLKRYEGLLGTENVYVSFTLTGPSVSKWSLEEGKAHTDVEDIHDLFTHIWSKLSEKGMGICKITIKPEYAPSYPPEETVENITGWIVKVYPGWIGQDVLSLNKIHKEIDWQIPAKLVKPETWRIWIKPIYEWIREKGWVKEEELYEEFKRKGVSEGDIREVIHYLIRTGSIYTPREGFLKPT